MTGVASEQEIQKNLSPTWIRTALKNSSITFYVKEYAESIRFKWKLSQRRDSTSSTFIPM